MRASITATAALLALAGCAAGGSESSAQEQTITEPTTTTQAQTTTEDAETTTEQATYTNDEFVAKLDAWCKSGNAESERRFRSAGDKAQAANDYEAYADVLQASRDFDAAEDKRIPVTEEELSPPDAQGFRRYLVLSNRLDGLINRLIVAVRARDDDEIRRLSGLIDQARNQRTNVTVDMGLSECGS